MFDVSDRNRIIELRERAINIEEKINRLLFADSHATEGREPSSGYAGHADQCFGGSTFAQHGDDLVAMNIFWNIGINFPTYIDVGAHHPFTSSNTALMHKLGCHGINVEPNPNLIKAFYEMRPDDVNVNVGVSDEAGELTFYMIDDFSGRNTFDERIANDFVAANPEFSIRERRKIVVSTINDIITQYAAGIFPDFLSLDIEGLDARVLGSVDWSGSKPKVICVEVMTGGASNYRKEIAKSLDGAGYFPYFRTWGNIFYVANEYKGALMGEAR